MTVSALLACLDADPAFEHVRELAEAGTGAVVEAPSAVLLTFANAKRPTCCASASSTS